MGLSPKWDQVPYKDLRLYFCLLGLTFEEGAGVNHGC